MNRCIVIVSGGLDSTTLLYRAKSEFENVLALSFDYGQRHKKELEYAQMNCKELNIPWHKVDLTSITSLLSGSSLTDKSVEVPEGHYEEESMKATVVPNRNTIMLSVAFAYCLSTKADQVWFGAHAGDHAIYPDCRQEYIHKLVGAFWEGNWPSVEDLGGGHIVKRLPQVVAPFIEMRKEDIVLEAARLLVPVQNTWSCYKGGERHCGKCGTCQERIEAFKKAKVIDPVEYEIIIDWVDCKKIW